jgi:hypothetical protein
MQQKFQQSTLSDGNRFILWDTDIFVYTNVVIDNYKTKHLM